MIPVLRAWGPALAWALLLFISSSIPGARLPDLTGLFQADKLVHLAIYAVLGGLCLRAVRRSTRLDAVASLLVAVVIASGYGATDELHQSFVPNRAADWRDLVADAAGALLGALVALRLLGQSATTTEAARETHRR